MTACWPSWERAETASSTLATPVGSCLRGAGCRGGCHVDSIRPFNLYLSKRLAPQISIAFSDNTSLDRHSLSAPPVTVFEVLAPNDCHRVHCHEIAMRLQQQLQPVLDMRGCKACTGTVAEGALVAEVSSRPCRDELVGAAGTSCMKVPQGHCNCSLQAVLLASVCSTLAST